MAETAATAAPFAVNDFFAGSGSINAQAARQAGQNRRGGGRFTRGVNPTANTTPAPPFAGRFLHAREPHARAAAGGRPRLLDDRHPAPDRPLRLGGRAEREELAGR